ncbi:MAG: hydantoinase/oxoprolinase family protein [Anaerolineales bacterium]
MGDLMLGIDTGGTYTDGVLFDQSKRKILKTTKTLTTKRDLKVGILKALDDLLPDSPSSIALVTISTTLATNAIAEHKGRPVALFLLGYDRELVERFQLDRRFATASYHYVEGGHDLYGNEQSPLDVEGIKEQAHQLAQDVDAFAVSGYFSPLNPSHEERAFAALSSEVDRPVILGHQLSKRLDSVQRATTATLNASLLSNLQDFIHAMHRALQERSIDAPLMVVKGDGALMNGRIAAKRPVETIHSGPAASATGGRFLAQKEQALVIDMGGTTTDIALIEGGKVQIREEGTSVGSYNTAVRAANIRSIGLGGDSLIDFTLEDQIRVGPARVRPLSNLAHDAEGVARDLERLSQQTHKHFSPQQLEYWYLLREPTHAIPDPRARDVLSLLEDGPMSLPAILEKMELFHPLQFGGPSLIKEEMIGRSGLTPTDLLHVTGEFSPWHEKVAEIGVHLMAGYMGLSVEDFIEAIKDHITERITREVISYLTGQSIDPVPYYVTPDDLGLWLFQENLTGEDPYVGAEISLKMPLIGIGAPANIFLPPVAKTLHTSYVSPPHYEVANAVGAVAGHITTEEEVWVYPQVKNTRTVGYFVQSLKDRKRFSTRRAALQYARQYTREKARQEAQKIGILDPDLEVIQLRDGAESTRIRAQAVGTPKTS